MTDVLRAMVSCFLEAIGFNPMAANKTYEKRSTTARLDMELEPVIRDAHTLG